MTSESRNTVLSYFSNTLYDGPSSWVSYDHEIIENNGWNMTVTSIETEEQLLETVYAAAAAKDPILFYMWTPHQIFGKYDLSRVSLPPYSTDCYADLDEVYCDYPDDILVKVYRKNFLDQSTLRVLQSFNLYNFDQIKMLSAVAYNGSTVEVAACNWVRKNRETWMQWIPPEPDNILRIALPSVIIPLVFIFCLGAGIASICHFRMKNKVAEEVVDLENQNAQLKLALMKTQDTTDFLNTPAETVVKMIEEFRKRHDWSPTELEDFNFIIKVISSRKLYTFDNEKTSQFLEEDVKDYLFDVTAIPRSKDVSAEQPENTLASSQQSHTSISEVIDKHFFDNVEQWEWDAISFANHSESNYLVHLANYIFDTHGFFEQLPLNRQKFNNFMDAVQKGYLDNPYHSGIHAADVTQALHLWIQQCSNAVCFTALELFSLLFSSLVHDLGHPGFNNNFMMASEDELALLYNDISILENYHVSYAFRLLKRPQCNFIEAMTPEQKKAFRSMSIGLVLATDMAKHVEVVGEFKAKVATAMDFNDAPSRNLLLRIMMKAADLVNTARPGPNAKLWATRVTQEFCRQGEREAALHLPISPFMDKNTNVARMQATFIEFIVEPLFGSLTKALPQLAPVYMQVVSNLHMWRTELGMHTSRSAVCGSVSGAPGLPQAESHSNLSRK